MNLFCTLVGNSSAGRKGSALSAVGFVLRAADEEWWTERRISGLSSGEGLIAAVRDPIEKPSDKKSGQVTDAGVTDKRLLVTEAEFARVLRVAARDGSTLSPIIRDAFDNGQLQVTTRSPLRASDAHISIIGHITKQELLKYLTDTEAANGFGNRFMWVCVKRSKLLPHGGKLREVNKSPLVQRLTNALRFARTAGEIERDPDANKLWEAHYAALTGWETNERFGIFGAVTKRAEAITLRVSCLYALLDCSALV